MFKKGRVQFQGGGMDAGAGQNFGGFRDRERDSNKPSTTSTTDDSTNTQTGGGSDSSQSQNLLSSIATMNISPNKSCEEESSSKKVDEPLGASSCLFSKPASPSYHP